jgi:hypothetical protein
MSDLETRAIAARDAVRQSVAALGLPPLETGPPQNRRWVVTMMATLLAVATIAGLAAYAGHRGQAVVPRPSAGSVPESGIPVGYHFEATGEINAFEDGQRNSITVYGEMGTEDPYERVDLAIEITGPPSSGTLPTSGERVTIGNGIEGVFSEQRSARNLWWKPAPTIRIRLASRTLRDDELIAIARQGRLVDSEFDPGPLPRGLSQVGRLDDYRSGAYTPGWIEGGASGRWVSYKKQGPGGARDLVAATASGGSDEFNVNRWLTGPNTTAITVRGRAGFMAQTHTASEGEDNDASLDSWVLFWQEPEGFVSYASGLGLTPTELVQFAASAAP